MKNLRLLSILLLLLTSIFAQAQGGEETLNLSPGQAKLWQQSDEKPIYSMTIERLRSMGYTENHSVGLTPNGERSNQWRTMVRNGELTVKVPEFPFAGKMYRAGSGNHKKYRWGYVEKGDPQYTNPTPLRWKTKVSMAADGTIWLVKWEEWLAVAAVSCGNDYEPGTCPTFVTRTMTRFKALVKVQNVDRPVYQTVKEPWYIYVDRPVPYVVSQPIAVSVLSGAQKTLDKVEFTSTHQSGFYIYNPKSCSISPYCPGGPGPLPTGDYPNLPPGNGPNNPEHGPVPFGGPPVGPPLGTGGYVNANGGHPTRGP